MSVGLVCRNAAGVVTFDSSRYGGVYVETLAIDLTTSGSVSYPAWAGREIFLAPAAYELNISSTAWYSVTVEYSLGYPRVVWTATLATSFTITVVVLVR